VNPFRKEFTNSDGSKWKSSHSPVGNHHLLVGDEIADISDPEVVGALAHFDTEEFVQDPPSLICLFLRPNEGLLLALNLSDGAGMGEYFRRVGAFTVYRSDWLKGAQSRCVTIA
jgi:hypothetical protein